ncbi:hypothetical protein B7494_g5619 [Chlorociboria aeruginascens]|nr:hypothetical protein B7494_g5619 [Chlorociboria aeruginascens]
MYHRSASNSDQPYKGTMDRGQLGKGPTEAYQPSAVPKKIPHRGRSTSVKQYPARQERSGSEKRATSGERSTISNIQLLEREMASPPQLRQWLYKIVQPRLGKGNYAEVWRAFINNTNIEMAVKVFSDTPDGRQRHKLEYRWYEAPNQLLHPSILPCYGWRFSPPVIFLKRKKLDLHMLVKEFKHRPFEEVRPALGPLLDAVIESVLSALKYLAGRDLVHRDVKPENIFLDSRKPPYDIQLGDVGLLEQKGDTGFQGSVGYIAPENFCGWQQTSVIDVWSLFATLVYVWTRGSLFTYTDSDSDKNTLAELYEVVKNPASPLLPNLGPAYDRPLRMILSQMGVFHPSYRLTADEILAAYKKLKQRNNAGEKFDDTDMGLSNTHYAGHKYIKDLALQAMPIFDPPPTLSVSNNIF